MTETKLKPTVYGVGINDADYLTYVAETNNGKQQVIWRCPYYIRWYSMLKRCYSQYSLRKRPSYEGCTVEKDWLTFSKFKAWMETQEWEGLQLDKDLLSTTNSLYSATTCVFVTQQINLFITEGRKSRGDYRIGTTFNKNSGRYRANCRNPFTLKEEHLGYFDCEIEAHKAWLSKKLEHAYALAAIQKDPRVAKALIDRYENYKSE